MRQESPDPLIKKPAAEAPAAPADAMPAEPGAETAQDPAATPAAPEAETAQDPAAMPAQPEAETAQTPDATAPDATMAPQDPALADTAPVLTPVAGDQISAETLIGARIQNPDGSNIAEVQDVLMSDAGAVENIVAQFGGFLGFGSNKVLLTMDEIEVLQDESGNFVVQTSLTPEALEGRPEYQAEN